VRRIAPLAWPLFIGQLSVLAFATIDTLLVARASAADLAALAVGAAAYATVFIGFTGVLMALAPIVGQLHGAGRAAEAGQRLHQAVWVALALALVGAGVLAFPQPFLALAHAGPEVAAKVRGYLLALAAALPAALLFAVYRAFNIAVARPRAVMSLQLAALALKVPLSWPLCFGVPALGLPAAGVVGCGIATCVAVWLQLALAVFRLRRDPAYASFQLGGPALRRPDRVALRQLLGLGLPIGAAIGVEVSGFSFMAIFISRLGTTPVAGHQIAINVVTLLFLVPLALGNASSTLVAQSLGAGRTRDAGRLGWHGLALGCAVAALMGGMVYLARQPLLGLYTRDAEVLAAALPLVAWVAVFHIADAAQTIAAFVLRAYKVAALPMVIYVAAFWGVGLGGGCVLAFDLPGGVPAALQGARGFWIACTAGLVLAAVALSGLLAGVLRRVRHEGATPGS
jgi:MATE family multidrug resistance protein